MANTNTNHDDDLRYGISALDLSFKDDAEKDELMVKGSNGKMYYKRESDGQIVSFEALEYNKETLVTAVNGAITENKLSIKPSKDDFLAYHTIDIAGLTSILDLGVVSFDFTSKFVASAVKAFFIRVRGNETTNSAISFIESIRKLTNSVKVKCEVTALGNGRETVIVESEGIFNDLIPVIIPDVSITDITEYEIKIISIEFSVKNAYEYLSETQKTLISTLNEKNTKLEADTIDVVTYVNDVNSTIIVSEEEKIKLNQILSINVIESEAVIGEAFVVSREQPDHECVWAQIKN